MVYQLYDLTPEEIGLLGWLAAQSRTSVKIPLIGLSADHRVLAWKFSEKLQGMSKKRVDMLWGVLNNE